MKIERFDRLALAHTPTPLEPMARLSEALKGPRLWVKRDDCTGLATGGNKIRKLEYLLAEAVRRGADTVLTPGAVQSNHVRQTAAAAARLGLHCHLLLEEDEQHHEHDYAHSGNVLIDRLCRARLHLYPEGADMDEAMEVLEKELEAAGKRTYAIPVGGSNARGALGYARCAKELWEQCKTEGFEPDLVVHASGSGGTQAGLIAGFAALGVDVPVLGVCVSRSGVEQKKKVLPLLKATLELLDVETPVPPERVRTNGNYVGKGFGSPTPEMVEAVQMVARLEGLLLDPEYTGKGMAGLIDLVRRGSLPAAGNVVFVHTGGAVTLFAYCALFDDVANA